MSKLTKLHKTNIIVYTICTSEIIFTSVSDVDFDAHVILFYLFLSYNIAISIKAIITTIIVILIIHYATDVRQYTDYITDDESKSCIKNICVEHK